MEQQFLDWFANNEMRFHQSQFDDRQIAYSAWLEGKNQALHLHSVSSLVCRTFLTEETGTSATKCKFCGKESWQH